MWNKNKGFSGLNLMRVDELEAYFEGLGIRTRISRHDWEEMGTPLRLDFTISVHAD